MLQQLQLFLDGLASPLGSNCFRALLSLAALLGMHPRIVAGPGVVFHLWLAFRQRRAGGDSFPLAPARNAA